MRASEFIIETTSAGGIATVASALGTASIYGNPSIYAKYNKTKGKKKSSKKPFQNSKE